MPELIVNQVGDVTVKTVGKIVNMIDWWSLTPYDKCSFRCVYCSVEAQGKSRPVIEPESIAPMLDEFVKHRGNLMLALGISSDAYPPEEAEHCLTRQMLPEIAKRNIPFTITTHGDLIVRDIDLLKECKTLHTIGVSIPNHNEELVRRFEPGAPSCAARIDAVQKLYDAGLPVHVNIAPWLPGMTDPDFIGRQLPADIVVNVTALSYNHTMRDFKKFLSDRELSSAERVFRKDFPTQESINQPFLEDYRRIRGGTKGNLVWLTPPGQNKSIIDRLPP